MVEGDGWLDYGNKTYDLFLGSCYFVEGKIPHRVRASSVGMFLLAIAESGQKHIIPWALEAQDKSFFPVLFELDTVYIGHRFRKYLQVYEQLLSLGFSKSEIDSGDYRSDRLMKVFDQYWELEEQIAAIRGARLMALLNYVSIVSN